MEEWLLPSIENTNAAVRVGLALCLFLLIVRRIGGLGPLCIVVARRRQRRCPGMGTCGRKRQIFTLRKLVVTCAPILRNLKRMPVGSSWCRIEAER